MEFALAGFKKDELSIDIQPDQRSITVRAGSGSDDVESEDGTRRIARRSFEKTYVNYDDNLDLNSATAVFENGLLTVSVPRRPEVKPLQVEIK
jgi:HSP20 family molecular chaperone IbpA